MLGSVEGVLAGFTELNDQRHLLFNPFFHAVDVGVGGEANPVHECSLPAFHPRPEMCCGVLAAFLKFPDELTLNIELGDARPYFRSAY